MFKVCSWIFCSIRFDFVNLGYEFFSKSLYVFDEIMLDVELLLIKKFIESLFRNLDI